MKKNTVLLYDPYLDVMGGGERHILSIVKVLEENGYDISVAWNEDLTRDIEKSLHIKFKHLRFVPNILTHHNNIFVKLPFLKKFDILIYVTNGGYFFSSAKKNFIFSMYPKAELYRKTLLTRMKWHNYRFISNSAFTGTRLEKMGVNSDIIYPYLDTEFLNIDSVNLKKDKIILSVGRFFKHLHAKRQDIAIQYFLNLKKRSSYLKDYSLILAGGLKDEDKEYYQELQKLRGDDKSIIFKPNISFTELLDLYKKAQMYWHFAGYGIDENKNPEHVEHLGITPLEAMSAGCLTFCYRAGGPKEIIKDGNTGFLFSDETELLEKINVVFKDTKQQKNIQYNAKKYVEKNFSYKIFKNRVEEIILYK